MTLLTLHYMTSLDNQSDYIVTVSVCSGEKRPRSPTSANPRVSRLWATYVYINIDNEPRVIKHKKTDVKTALQ